MPTNDELRAAAERVRLCRSRSMLTVYGVESLPDATALYFDDAYAIAEARLSQPAPATDEQIAELKRILESGCNVSRSDVEALISRLERVEAEIERLRKDAARYRFIRQKRVGVLDCTWPLWNSTETLDAAIDAAMQETNDA